MTNPPKLLEAQYKLALTTADPRAADGRKSTQYCSQCAKENK